jgi:hypothetical protein
MTSRRTQQITAAALILGSALIAGGWGYYQTQPHARAETQDNTPAPTYPTGYTPVQIDHPPQREDHTPQQAPDAAGKTPDPLSQLWEFNAQQPPALLPQPLTEPNWYITGVVQQGENTRVMVQFQGESQVRFYKVGDVLPGGSKLAWVKPGAIGVVTPQRKKLQVPILDGASSTHTNTGKAPSQATGQTPRSVAP